MLRAGLALAVGPLAVAGCSTGGSGATRSTNAVVQDLPNASAAPAAQVGGIAEVGADKVFSAVIDVTATDPTRGSLTATVVSDLSGGDVLRGVRGPRGITVTLRPSPLRLRYEHPVVLSGPVGTPTVTVTGLPSAASTVSLRLRFARAGTVSVAVPIVRSTR